MSDAAAGRAGATAGPAFSFGFNLGKIPDHGEDSDPIRRDGPDLGLIGVFDGMGGAGGTVYETPDGPRSGAYLASRIARDVVESRMLELLEPFWMLDTEVAAEDLRRSIRGALQDRLAELNAPVSRLRSKLLRALPTTMAVIALQRTRRGGDQWMCHVFWAGDSRAYAVDAGGVHQLSSDDLRDGGDAMENLRADSVVSNALSADTDFRINYRSIELEAPFALMCATDGCYGYFPSPMHFERLLLHTLGSADSVAEWSAAVQEQISAVTGDDAAMSFMAVGADFAAVRAMLSMRLGRLDSDFVTPLDAAAEAVSRAEHELERARVGRDEVFASRWDAYKAGYESFLRVDSEAADGTPAKYWNGPVPAADSAPFPIPVDGNEDVDGDADEEDDHGNADETGIGSDNGRTVDEPLGSSAPRVAVDAAEPAPRKDVWR